MKKIEESEFLNDMIDYARNEISLKKLLIKYETDYRTMHNRITKLSETHPDIFKLIVEAHPYSEKKKNHIDFGALMLEIMKTGITVQEAAEKYDIGVRTIQRRVVEISETDPEFVRIYKICLSNRKKGKENSKEIREKIDKYEFGPVIISDINENRENELLKLKKDFDGLVESGMSRNEAAKKIGVQSSQDIYKIFKNLERIQAEKQIRQDGSNRFLESIKVEIEDDNSDKQSGDNKENTTNQIQKNQEER